MKLYRDVDYFLYFLDFPHMGVPGLIVGNTDGTANIYINTLYSEVIQRRTVKHELRHLCLDHLSDDTITITKKELEAEEIDDPSIVFAEDFSSVERVEQEEADPPIDWLFNHPPGVIACFNSLDSLLHWAKGYARWRRENNV